VCEQERPAAHTRRRERSLGPSVAAADHDDLIFSSEYHEFIDIFV